MNRKPKPCLPLFNPTVAQWGGGGTVAQLATVKIMFLIFYPTGTFPPDIKVINKVLNNNWGVCLWNVRYC